MEISTQDLPIEVKRIAMVMIDYDYNAINDLKGGYNEALDYFIDLANKFLKEKGVGCTDDAIRLWYDNKKDPAHEVATITGLIVFHFFETILEQLPGGFMETMDYCVTLAFKFKRETSSISTDQWEVYAEEYGKRVNDPAIDSWEDVIIHWTKEQIKLIGK